MQPTRQARLPLTGEVEVQLNGLDRHFVGVQNIALARLDVEPHNGSARRVVLNLYGTRDIDRLIAALESAKATIQAEQAALDAYFKAHPAWLEEGGAA